ADLVRLVAFGELHAAHRRAVEEFDPQRSRAFAEEVLEPAPVQLPGRRRQQPADAQLGAAVELFAALAEEETEAELADLRRVQVLAQAEHVGEIVRADLDRRLADLERGLAHRVPDPLQYHHPDGRVALPQLQCQAKSRKASAGNGDVGTAGAGGHLLGASRGVPGAANSPLGSSIRGGLARALRHACQIPPWRSTVATTWDVMRVKSR